MFYCVLQDYFEYRRSDSNRHGAFAPPDFESGASTNSATPAWRTATLYQCTQLGRLPMMGRSIMGNVNPLGNGSRTTLPGAVDCHRRVRWCSRHARDIVYFSTI